MDRPKNLLLVEDDFIIAMAEARQLEAHGYRVVHAPTGESAIELGRGGEDIDLVLMDIDLGEGSIDGTEAARKILALRDIPLLFLSSHTEKDIVDKTESITNYGYVVKNSSVTVLDASIKMAFKLFEAQRLVNAANMEIERTNEELRVTVERLGESNAALAESESLYHALFSDNLVVMLLVDPATAAIVDANESACSYYGYPHSTIINMKVTDINVDSADLIFGNIEAARTGAGNRFEVRHRLANGEIREVAVYTSHLQMEGRNILHSIIIDITERKAASLALERSEAELKRSQAVAHVGSWVWHIKSNSLEWSDEMYRLFGISRADFTGDLATVIARAIHPDDRAAVEASNQLVMERGTPIPLEYRIVLPDGSIRRVWAEAGALSLDTEGRPDRLSGIVMEIGQWR
ncbi:MAG: PAS domain-containing protein [Treponema sp.]|nr:PAS domain-containing protein [Treponema sp.]